MSSPSIDWDNIHHRSSFLPKLRRIETGEVFSTMNGDNYFPINPLATHRVDVKGNMESNATMIPINISKTLVLWRMFSLERTNPPKIFELTLIYSKCNIPLWRTDKTYSLRTLARK
jgi:hypothetical protein